jgi:hypothetical protein
MGMNVLFIQKNGKHVSLTDMQIATAKRRGMSTSKVSCNEKFQTGTFSTCCEISILSIQEMERSMMSSLKFLRGKDGCNIQRFLFWIHICCCFGV